MECEDPYIVAENYVPVDETDFIYMSGAGLYGAIGGRQETRHTDMLVMIDGVVGEPLGYFFINLN